MVSVWPDPLHQSLPQCIKPVSMEIMAQTGSLNYSLWLQPVRNVSNGFFLPLVFAFTEWGEVSVGGKLQAATSYFLCPFIFWVPTCWDIGEFSHYSCECDPVTGSRSSLNTCVHPCVSFYLLRYLNVSALPCLLLHYLSRCVRMGRCVCVFLPLFLMSRSITSADP